MHQNNRRQGTRHSAHAPHASEELSARRVHEDANPSVRRCLHYGRSSPCNLRSQPHDHASARRGASSRSWAVAISSRENCSAIGMPPHPAMSASLIARAASSLSADVKSSLPRKSTRTFLKSSGQNGMPGCPRRWRRWLPIRERQASPCRPRYSRRMQLRRCGRRRSAPTLDLVNRIGTDLDDVTRAGVPRSGFIRRGPNRRESPSRPHDWRAAARRCRPHRRRPAPARSALRPDPRRAHSDAP